jgi:hypothetical protein
MEPGRFEQTVASVYRSLGYLARVTGHSGDGGIDVVLEGPDGILVGVQVKRYRDRIEVEQIRSLAGALLLRGLTGGVFVTTSTFRSGATKAARLAASRGYPIELVDSAKFFDALKIAQRRDRDGVPSEPPSFDDADLHALQTLYMQYEPGRAAVVEPLNGALGYVEFEDLIAVRNVTGAEMEESPGRAEPAGGSRLLPNSTKVRVIADDIENRMFQVRADEDSTPQQPLWVDRSQVTWSKPG